MGNCVSQLNLPQGVIVPQHGAHMHLKHPGVLPNAADAPTHPKPPLLSQCYPTLLVCFKTLPRSVSWRSVYVCSLKLVGISYAISCLSPFPIPMISLSSIPCHACRPSFTIRTDNIQFVTPTFILARQRCSSVLLLMIVVTFHATHPNLGPSILAHTLLSLTVSQHQHASPSTSSARPP